MDAQTAQLEPEEVQLQEQFAGQVEDTSRPAQDVLTDQQATVVSGGSSALFVP
jgi:hypothetical protein